MALRTYPNLQAYFRGEGATQGALAHELGISQALLSMIKWGLREPDLALALRIAERCRVPLESLVMPRDRSRRKVG
jgi:DNA-binding XRE family transcriptional regulator